MMPRTTLFQMHSLGTPKYAPKYTLKMLPSTLPSTLPIALDYTLPACLTVHSQVRSEGALKMLSSKFLRHSQVHSQARSQDAPKYAPKYAPDCTRLHTPSMLGFTLQSMLPTTLARTFPEVHLSVGYLVCLDVETGRVAGTTRQTACGGRHMAGGL